MKMKHKYSKYGKYLAINSIILSENKTNLSKNKNLNENYKNFVY